MRLLYVEDDLIFAQVLHAHLLTYKAVSWDLVHVTRLSEAVARLAEEEFDAVVLDLGLPDSDGLDTCARLCAASPGVLTVVLSATDDEQDAIRAIELGADDYLFKQDLDGRRIMRRVRFAIERRKWELRQSHLAWIVPGCPPAQRGPAAQPGGSGPCKAAAGRVEDAGCIAGEPPPDSPLDPVRLLHVEDDPALLRIAEKILSEAPAGFRVDQAPTMGAAIEQLRRQPFGAVLLDLSLPESEGLDTLATVQAHAGMTPIIVVTASDDESTAVQCIQRGAHDFLTKTRLDRRALVRCVRMAVVRHARRCQASPGARGPRGAPVWQPAGAAASPAERRKHPRYLLSRPIFVIPVRPNDEPDAERLAEGYLIDVSSGGVSCEVAEQNRLVCKRLILGVEADDGTSRLATLEVRHAVPCAAGVRIGARFASPARDLFCETNVMPSLDPATCRFQTRLPAAVLARWVGLGLLRPVLVDRVLVCPRCRALPTLRWGCRACGSVRLASCQLIHHFACAHVGYVSDFEHQGQVVCPKCRTSGLVVGADFEHLDGPYRCLDCDWSDTQLEQVGQCLRCALRFPLGQASEEELIGYDVHRLDPLALIAAN